MKFGETKPRDIEQLEEMWANVELAARWAQNALRYLREHLAADKGSVGNWEVLIGRLDPWVVNIADIVGDLQRLAARLPLAEQSRGSSYVAIAEASLRDVLSALRLAEHGKRERALEATEGEVRT